MLDTIISHSHDEVEEMLRSVDQPSVYEDYRDFKIFVIRRLSLENEKISFTPEAFVIKDNHVYHYDKAKDDLVLLKNHFQGLLSKLERYYKNNQKIIYAYTNQVESLEDYLFERNTPSYFMDLWFDIKKEFSKLENYYYRSTIVYREFFKSCSGYFDRLTDEFKDVEESFQFQMSSVDTLMTRLDGVYRYYESIKADRMNKTLLGLTIISGIFLPLNLIVGFFGMNTQGLYFQTDPEGTEKVLIVLAGVLLLFLLGFKLVQLADRYLLRFVLGRYDFYKNLSTNIEELSSRFRGK